MFSSCKLPFFSVLFDIYIFGSLLRRGKVRMTAIFKDIPAGFSFFQSGIDVG